MQKTHIHQLKALLKDDKFDALVAFYDEYITRIREDNIIGATSDETLKLTYMREGRIMGIQDFFNQLDQEVND